MGGDMNLEHICYGCFREKQDGAHICSFCGFNEEEKQPFLALPMGTLLHGRYMTGRVLGVGGFGITYLGYDFTLEIKVAIKEYMPSGFVTRHSDRYRVVLTGQDREEYQNGMKRFLDEARILARLQNTPNIVSVQDYFKENNTAYFVMEYIDGMSLKAYLVSKGGKIPYTEALEILIPVMRALEQVHAMKLTHRDISPDNISLTSGGESKLLDFGAARFASGDAKSVSVILKHGYAPEEQYSGKGNQGPWTDVYAMGATMYRCVTGELPPDSIARIHKDTLKKPSELGISLSSQVEQSLLKALSVKAEDRYSSMTDFINALSWKEQADSLRKSQKTWLWTRLQNRPLSVRIAAIFACTALIVFGMLKTASGIGTLVDSKTDSDTEAPGMAAELPVSEQDDTSDQNYVQSYLNISMRIPDGYTETKSGSSTFVSSDGEAFLRVGFYDKNAGFPVYTLSDVEENAEALVSYCIAHPESPGLPWKEIAAYEITDKRYQEIGGQNAYLIWLSAKESGDTAMEFLAAFIECRNGFGCYHLVGAYPKGDDAAGAELLTAMNTFQSTGPAGTIYRRFYDERLPFQFLYWENPEEISFHAVNENRLKIENSHINMEIQCESLQLIPDKESWLDALTEEVGNMSGLETRGTRWKSNSGGIDWMVDGYTVKENGHIAYMDIYCGEYGGYVFLVLVSAETEQDLLDGLLLDVTNTIRPVK